MKLALGTVQFGLDYGISNTGGRTALPEVVAILDAARGHGIDLLDTAAAYGDAENVLAQVDARGRGFAIVSKTARLAGGLDAAIARARQSVVTLGRPLDALLVHAASDLALPDGDALWAAMCAMRDAGDVRRIGLSVYASDPVLDYATRFQPDVIQLPTSVVDQRLVRDGTLEALAARGIEIHVRSAFHQGLIFVDPQKLPPKLADRADVVATMQARLRAGGLSPLESALAYLKGLPQISAIVVGVTKRSELDEIAAAFATTQSLADAATCAIDDPLLLDPTRW